MPSSKTKFILWSRQKYQEIVPALILPSGQKQLLLTLTIIWIPSILIKDLGHRQALNLNLDFVTEINNSIMHDGTLGSTNFWKSILISYMYLRQELIKYVLITQGHKKLEWSFKIDFSPLCMYIGKQNRNPLLHFQDFFLKILFLFSKKLFFQTFLFFKWLTNIKTKKPFSA